MAEFLITSGIASKIDNIIVKAKKQIYLVTPYLQLSNNLIERLDTADKKGIAIHLVYGKSELNSKEDQLLAGLKMLKLYYYQNLHAKCYFNEQEMVITSMNLYEYSEKNNREMGIYLNREGDRELYTEACRESLDIISKAELRTSVQSKAKEPKEPYRKQTIKVLKLPEEGYCIRCSEILPLNPTRPLCYTCFDTWRQFEDGQYPERFCQVCGERSDVCFDSPACYSCYKKHKKELNAIVSQYRI